MTTAWRQAQVVDLHRQGLSIGEIAEATGCEEPWINRALRAARERGDLPPLKSHDASGAEWRAKAAADWESGNYCIAEIARRTGMAPSSISRFLHQTYGDRLQAKPQVSIAPKRDAFAPALGIRIGKVVVKREALRSGGVERMNMISLSSGIAAEERSS